MCWLSLLAVVGSGVGVSVDWCPSQGGRPTYQSLSPVLIHSVRYGTLPTTTVKPLLQCWYRGKPRNNSIYNTGTDSPRNNSIYNTDTEAGQGITASTTLVQTVQGITASTTLVQTVQGITASTTLVQTVQGITASTTLIQRQAKE